MTTPAPTIAKPDKRDAATRAVEHLIEQKLVDPFQRYNIAQIIREEYNLIAEPSVPVSEIEALVAEWREEDPELLEEHNSARWACAGRLAALVAKGRK